MPSSTHLAALAVSLTRSVAFAALLSAPLAALPWIPAQAQSTPSTQAAANPADERAETVEQRITKLHQDLKIAPDQETKWNDVAQAMRDNAANMEKLVAEKRRQAPQNMTAIDDLDTYQKFAQQHVDGLKKLTSAFKSLYSAMSDQQKKNADQVFESFGRTPAPGRG
jgi:protein CpxP